MKAFWFLTVKHCGSITRSLSKLRQPWLKDATGNTPFMLIARNQSSDWQQYNIKQNGDDFVLTPKASNGNLKQFTINVGRDGTIHQFSAVEQDDQRSSYQLKSQQNGGCGCSEIYLHPRRKASR